MENRRKETRYRILSKGFVKLNNHRIAMQTENISKTGVRISTDRPLLEGEDVLLELHLPRKKEGILPMNILGTVVWCTEDMDAGFQIGISFSLNAKETEQMDKCLELQSEST